MTVIRIDSGLTPDNCKDKGFEWRGDSIYDPEAPEEANNNFIETINNGWKLGKSASTSFEENGGVGLYKPLSTPEKP